MSPVLVLVESNTTGTGRLFAQRARRLGIRPVLFSRDPGRYSFVELDGVESVTTDTADDAALVDCVDAMSMPPSGVMSSSEYYVPAAARLAGHLGLPGPDPEAVLRCRNKNRQRLALARAGVPGPRFAAARTAAEAAEAAGSIGYPVVVKPTEGSGSVGVRRCDDGRQVIEHASELLRTGRFDATRPPRTEILIEEYLVGAEYSVETFDGEVVSVVAKRLGPPPHFVETGHDVPAEITDNERAALASLGLAALRALSLDFGAAHIEARMTASGPRVVEVNPRLAGGMIPELVRVATGVDMITAQLLAVLGEDVGHLVADRQRYASLRFLTVPRSATVCVDRGVQETAARVPSVSDVVLYKREGERVDPAVDFSGRIGHVFSVSDNPEGSRIAAMTALEQLRALVHPLPERTER